MLKILNKILSVITSNNHIFKCIFTLGFKSEEIEIKFQEEKYSEIKYLIVTIFAFISFVVSVIYVKKYFLDSNENDLVFPQGYNKNMFYISGLYLVFLLHFKYSSGLLLFLRQNLREELLCGK